MANYEVSAGISDFGMPIVMTERQRDADKMRCVGGLIES